MNTKLVLGLLGVLLASCLPHPVLADSSDSSKTLAGALLDLRPKQVMRAQLDGKSFEGQFVGFNESSLTLRVDVFDNVDLPLHSVTELSIATDNHTEEGLKLGAVAGAFVGIAFAYTLPQLGSSRRGPAGGEVIVLMSLGTVAGAAVGGAVGATQRVWSQIWP